MVISETMCTESHFQIPSFSFLSFSYGKDSSTGYGIHQGALIETVGGTDRGEEGVRVSRE